ncbi:MAG: hypothetical protein HRT45_15915, partial [Bdellovibrionales bacterium]|nr:hypothetical protein [Bdellovibrionales bacterium]
MRIWKQKSLLLFLATALMLSFQNCSAPSASSPVGVVSQATSGNGDAYDGKLVVTAPEIVTPGQTVEVSILGGAPPYQLTSDSSSAQIVETSVGIYALTVDVNTSGGVISLQATDSNGELATTEIQVWGINRWFFSQPTGLAVDSRGHTFVLEADRPSLIELDANGDLVQRYTNTDLSADLVSPTHLEIDALDNLYISDSSSRVVVIDAVTKRVQRIIEDSADQYWSDCGGIQDMKVDAGGAIFV